MDLDFVRTLSPQSHFIGGRDGFNSFLHSGGSALSAIGRAKTGLSCANSNIKIMIEVSFCL